MCELEHMTKQSALVCDSHFSPRSPSCTPSALLSDFKMLALNTQRQLPLERTVCRIAECYILRFLLFYFFRLLFELNDLVFIIKCVSVSRQTNWCTQWRISTARTAYLQFPLGDSEKKSKIPIHLFSPLLVCGIHIQVSHFITTETVEAHPLVSPRIPFPCRSHVLAHKKCFPI